MTKARVVETNRGIQDATAAEMFDLFARQMRDKGWNGVDTMIASGIRGGDILEIGPGPGYVGLEVMKKAEGGTLTGYEISPAMIRIARRNALDYGIEAEYVEGNAMNMPFEDESFDCVISNDSLHEWEDPVRVFNEIHRVLRPGGLYCITDLRRDVAFWKKIMVFRSIETEAMKQGLSTSLAAAYVFPEIWGIMRRSKLKSASVKEDFFGLRITGKK